MANDNGILAGTYPTDGGISLFLVQVLIIVILCRLLSIAMKPLRQPSVVAEILAGIILGPSVLGLIPGYMTTLFPKPSLLPLEIVANIGLIFYLFLIGLELDPSAVRQQFKQSFAISVAGILMPFAITVGTAYVLWTTYMESSVNFGVFYLFMGVAMGITAFPVLARILGELRLFATPVGVQTISSAACDDIIAWTLLALVVGIVSGGSPLNAFFIVLMTIAFASVMIFGVSRLLAMAVKQAIDDDGKPAEWSIALMLIVMLTSALITQIIGIHAIFGAFIAGLATPRCHGFDIALTERIEDLITIVFLPLYFTYSGLKTNIGSLSGVLGFAMVILAIATACFGKIAGCTLAGKVAGLNWREALSVGVLMNAKGLVELVVLNIGLEAGIINDQVFAIMVLMAVCTTFLTVPLISFIYPPRYYLKSASLDEDVEMTAMDRFFGRKFRPLVCLPGLRYVPTLMHLVQLFVNETKEDDHLLSIEAVRMVESSDRFSSLLKIAHQGETLKSDPVLKVFNTYAAINNIDVKDHIAFNTNSELPAEVAAIADVNNLDMIFIPWQHSRQGNQNLQYTVSTTNSHAVVKHLLKETVKSVAVILDQGFMPDGKKAKKILVAFYGGPDDEEALMIASRMSQHGNVMIRVLRISLDEPEIIAVSSDGPDGSFDHSRSRRGSNASRRSSTEFERLFFLLSDEKFKNVEVVSVQADFNQTYKPVEDALKQDAYDLVIFGYQGSSWARMKIMNEDPGEIEEAYEITLSAGLQGLKQGFSLPLPTQEKSSAPSIKSLFKKDSTTVEDMNEYTVTASTRLTQSPPPELISSQGDKQMINQVLGELGEYVFPFEMKATLMSIRSRRSCK